MNYPVWYLPETGGGFLVALIAILHVFVSHFAVGGGLYLIYAEKKGLKENSPLILNFVKDHARFFLLVTMVFGSITGVGIWFIIALVSPAATSFLIHNFVFGWAAEWVFFTVEIAAAFVYFYTFDKMDSSTHLKVGWVYFIAAWMSLLLINGIIGVMLTPGAWAENMDFWVGFFNPSFFPALFFRTFIAVMIASCYGYFSASFAKNKEVRLAMTRFSAKWALLALAGAIPSGLWYLSVLPDQAYALIAGQSPTIAAILPWGASGTIVFLAIMLGAGISFPSFNLKPVAVLALVSALAIMGSFEWTREAARRPYVINEVMYSNGIFKKDVGGLNQEGFLQSAVWVQNRELTEGNQRLAGEELFVQQCYACHTVNGRNNDIVAATKNMSFRAMTSYIQKIHDVRYFMPPFVGTEAESQALAAYIVGSLHGKETVEPEPATGSAELGAVLFEDNCSSCHEVDDLVGSFEDVEKTEISEMLATLDAISDEMVPFDGTPGETDQLSGYLYSFGNESETETTIDGEFVYKTHCSSCHGMKIMERKMVNKTQDKIYDLLGRLPELQRAMPPFRGTEAEREALSQFLESLGKGGQ